VDQFTVAWAVGGQCSGGFTVPSMNPVAHHERRHVTLTRSARSKVEVDPVTSPDAIAHGCIAMQRLTTFGRQRERGAQQLMIGGLSDPGKPTERFFRMREVGERQREVRQRLMELPESPPDDARFGGIGVCDPFPEGDNHSLPIVRAGINDTCRRNDGASSCRHMRRQSDGFAHAEIRFGHPRDDFADLNDGRQRARAENSRFARRKRVLTSNSDRKSDAVRHDVKVLVALGATERLRVGRTVDHQMLGYSTWEVVRFGRSHDHC
jgi:hypothetical protein